MTTRTIYNSYPWDARRYYCERVVSRFMYANACSPSWRRYDLPRYAVVAQLDRRPGAHLFAAAVDYLFAHYPDAYNFDLLLK